MATGIVEVCAKSGYDVVFRARGEDKVAAVRKKLEGSLEKAVQKGKLTEDARTETLGRVTGTTSLEDLKDCDLVIEAVAEQLDIKRGIFAALDDVMKPGAILATTTSSLPVIECATATKRPGDVIGMHWFNPATVMKLVEVVPTVTTSPDVIATVLTVCAKVKKHPVLCGDRAGFIVNALLFPYLNDGVKMLEAHYATIDDIDFAMTSGCGHPMGPFALMDVVGLDVTLAIQQTLFDEFREPGDSPAPMLEHLVKAGYLGRKTGRGFRDYAKQLVPQGLSARAREAEALAALRTDEGPVMRGPAGERVEGGYIVRNVGASGHGLPVPWLRAGRGRRTRMWWPFPRATSTGGGTGTRRAGSARSPRRRRSGSGRWPTSGPTPSCRPSARTVTLHTADGLELVGELALPWPSRRSRRSSACTRCPAAAG